MSSVDATPRKRPRTDDGPGTGPTPKRRTGAAPKSNPPHAPFPTPPRSRRRRVIDDEPTPRASSSLSTHSSFSSLSSLSAPSTSTLPAHLQTLLTLHRAFNITLSLHLATHPPVLPPHPASTTRLQLPNLTNLLAIRDAVERTSGRRFGAAELARLAWLWTWDGETLPEEHTASGSRLKHDDDVEATPVQSKLASPTRLGRPVRDDANPFLVTSTPSAPTSITGLSYLVTTTRTLDSSGRRVHTHGIGIELELQPGETRNVLSTLTQGQGGGVRVVGRWNAGAEMREDIVRTRLERWTQLHSDSDLEGVPLENGSSGSTDADEKPQAPVTAYPTPSKRDAEPDSARSTIPPIPLHPLPKLPSSTPAATLFSIDASGAPGLTGTPRRPKAGSLAPMGLSDPFELMPKPKPSPSGSVEERRKALYDRIKARADSKKATRTTLHDAIHSGGAAIRNANASGSASPSPSTPGQDELKRRATLSRLESVAEGVWMMFSAPSPGPSSLPSAPRGRRKAIPLDEVADMIVKSSKTPISTAEARTSLELLTQLCPFFLTIKTVGRADWLEMPPSLTLTAPPSLTLTAPLTPLVPGAPVSPGRNAPASPGSLAGPASPGRVSRVGGLRAVRERIRRELGDA